MKKGTYVYCLVAAARRPSLARVPAGPSGLGPARLLDLPGTTFRHAHRNLSAWLVVADAPLDKYGEEAINRGLSDLDWVARTAVAHEAVIESLVAAAAVLPMKLFTIFASDERAREYIGRERRLDAVVQRVANHQEWGVRVVLDRAGAQPAVGGSTRSRKAAQPVSGENFLRRKKAERDASAELARRAQETISDLYERLSTLAREAKRRAAGELPVEGGPLLLDAAFLVPAKKSARFRKEAGRQAQALGRHGYHVTLTGPWPPYSFVQD